MFNSGATLLCHWKRINLPRRNREKVDKHWNRLLLAASEMPKHAKGKGPRAAKVTKAPARVTRSTSGGTPQGLGRSEGEGGLSSSAIGREEVALVVEEVLKTLKQRDIAPSGPNRNDITPSQRTTSESEATSSRSPDVVDPHPPG